MQGILVDLVEPWRVRIDQVYEDPLEERDRAADRPELVAELAAALEAWPRGPALDRSVLQILWDPDSFGGPEDREPWADAARRLAAPNPAPAAFD